MDAPRVTPRARTVTVAVLIWVAALHLLFGLSAGPLWRDEANSIQQATLRGWDEVWTSLSFDSFPALYPAFLRGWSGLPGASTDAGLRVLGVLTGIALVATVLGVGKLLGSGSPIVVLALLCADPLAISETDSVRPYGLTLILLLWCFGALGRCASVGHSWRWLWTAVAAAVLAAQAAYTSVIFSGIMGVVAGVLAALQGERRRLAAYAFPCAAAALSLLPYRHAVAEARSWAVLVQSGVHWPDYFRAYIGSFTAIPLVALAAFAGWSAWLLVSRSDGCAGAVEVKYAAAVAFLSLAAQLAMVEVLSVPPFPRYFLPALTFAAFGCEMATRAVRGAVRQTAVVAVLLCCAWPAWSWLSLRRTNVDHVAAALENAARRDDLIVVSPWFLSVSFQRYYKGSTPWITWPEIGRYPTTRYDRVRSAIRKEDPAESTARLQALLSRARTVWFVTQQKDASRVVPPPVIPPRAETPSGADYVRFRSYWETGIEFELARCCRGERVALPGGRVWKEEKLSLTQWHVDRTR